MLDECHHLLEVWGRLLREVLDELPHAFVLGLTATPPSTLTADQKALVDELFGDRPGRASGMPGRRAARATSRRSPSSPG